MKTRILSALIMLPLLIIVFIGDYVLYGACFAVSITAVNEFYKGFHELDIHPSFPIAVGAAVLLYTMTLTSSPEVNPYGDGMVSSIFINGGMIMFWFFAVILAGLLYLFNIKNRKLEDALSTITGIFYIIFFFYHIALIGFQEHSIIIWLVFITAFGTDIMAYFTGYAFGKHKLCPNISPKKTIEGSVGGTLGSIILSGIFGFIFMPDMLIHCLVIGFLGGIVSQLGDLTASIFKRKMGIKDYGHLIPGHGGILDRFDSVLFTGPLVYYYLTIVIYGISPM